MGGGRHYLKEGGFSEYLYETVGEVKVINGIRAKVVKLKTDECGTHSSLPQFANSSDMYFRLGADGLPCQAKVYVNRRMCIDFDWGHVHTNPDGSRFEKGTVHVQTYSLNADGSLTRHSDKARLMSDSEIRTYGPVIAAFNPNVKLRP